MMIAQFNTIFLPDSLSNRNKDFVSRLRAYVRFLEQEGADWVRPDFEDYRVYLVQERNLKDSSVVVFLRAIRARYRELIEEGKVDDARGFYLRAALTQSGMDVADFEAFFHDVDKRLRSTHVEIRSELPHQYYQPEQVASFLHEKPLDTLQDLRDILVFGLIAFAGLDEHEICALERNHMASPDRIWVPAVAHKPKGREVEIYDDRFYSYSWLPAYIEAWMDLDSARFPGRNLFVSFFRGGQKPRSSLTISGVQHLMRMSPVPDVEEDETFTVLNLRRFYARQLFLRGGEVETIQHNLGHQLRETTLEYIGLPDRDFHEPSYADPEVLLQKLRDCRYSR
jgi:integrase